MRACVRACVRVGVARPIYFYLNRDSLCFDGRSCSSRIGVHISVTHELLALCCDSFEHNGWLQAQRLAAIKMEGENAVPCTEGVPCFRPPAAPPHFSLHVSRCPPRCFPPLPSFMPAPVCAPFACACPPSCLSVGRSLGLSACLSVCLSACLSVCLAVISVSLSVCPPVSVRIRFSTTPSVVPGACMTMIGTVFVAVFSRGGWVGCISDDV